MQQVQGNDKQVKRSEGVTHLKALGQVCLCFLNIPGIAELMLADIKARNELRTYFLSEIKSNGF